MGLEELVRRLYLKLWHHHNKGNIERTSTQQLFGWAWFSGEDIFVG